jgi:hypothetical protein
LARRAGHQEPAWQGYARLSSSSDATVLKPNSSAVYSKILELRDGVGRYEI